MQGNGLLKKRRRPEQLKSRWGGAGAKTVSQNQQAGGKDVFISYQ